MIAGVDYSVNCPCLCLYNPENKLIPQECMFYYIQKGVTDKEFNRRLSLNLPYLSNNRQILGNHNIERYYNNAKFFAEIIKNNNVDVVILEDYALRSNGKGI